MLLLVGIATAAPARRVERRPMVERHQTSSRDASKSTIFHRLFRARLSSLRCVHGGRAPPSTFSHDGGRVYPTHTRNHPAWRGTHRARRPRAHGSAEASPAQHHCTLRARSLMHSSLDAVQSGVANANHHCNSTANICTTTPSMHTRGGTCRANASTLPASHRAIHCRRPGLAALLLALLHAHLIALHLL